MTNSQAGVAQLEVSEMQMWPGPLELKAALDSNLLPGVQPRTPPKCSFVVWSGRALGGFLLGRPLCN